MVFGTIVLIDQHSPNVAKTGADSQPEIPQAIHDEIAGDSRCSEIQIHFVVLGQQDPERDQLGIGLEVVICCPDNDTCFAVSRKGTNQHRGLAIR
jgi:hypothetical protein